jgi:hypothetical protein
MTVVTIHDPDSPVQIDDIADALDRQIDLLGPSRRYSSRISSAMLRLIGR